MSLLLTLINSQIQHIYGDEYEIFIERAALRPTNQIIIFNKKHNTILKEEVPINKEKDINTLLNIIEEAIQKTDFKGNKNE